MKFNKGPWNDPEIMKVRFSTVLCRHTGISLKSLI